MTISRKRIKRAARAMFESRSMFADWQPIETAPRDGTEILAHIPGYGDYRLRWQRGFEGVDGSDCATWVCLDYSFPRGWTDGVCWASNEDEKPCVRPTHWRPSFGEMLR